MKNNIRSIFLILAVLAWSLPAGAQQPIMGGEASVTALDVTHDGNTVHVKMSLDVTNLKVGGDETVVLTPVLANGDRSADLPSIEIMGRRAYLYSLRNDGQTVTSDPAYAERTARRAERKAGPQIISYAVSVPYASWMKGANVSVREGSCGCSNTLLALGESPVDRVLYEPYVPQYLLSFVEPEPEPVKVREEKFSAYVNFYVDKWAILENYKNNASELAGIRESVGRVADDKDLTIESILIEGWASPEAPEDYNLRLSQRRANSLADYVAEKTGIDRAMMEAKGRGEDWAGLREGVIAMKKLLNDDKVLAVIDDTSLSFDARESALKKLIPAEIYQRLYNEIYPSLRRNDYRIVYKVRNFDPEEARELLDKAPRKLSLGEMYQIAGLYEKGSAEYNHVMEVAARTYPSEVAAAVNAAIALIEAGRYNDAVAHLRKSDTDDARVLNALGVAYGRQGDTDAAREAFEKAAASGSAEARHNLGELAKSLE